MSDQRLKHSKRHNVHYMTHIIPIYDIKMHIIFGSRNINGFMKACEDLFGSYFADPEDMRTWDEMGFGQTGTVACPSGVTWKTDIYVFLYENMQCGYDAETTIVHEAYHASNLVGYLTGATAESTQQALDDGGPESMAYLIGYIGHVLIDAFGQFSSLRNQDNER